MSISKRSSSLPAAEAKAKRRTRICTSVSGRSLGALARKAAEALEHGSDLVEFRFDLLPRIVPGEAEEKLSEFRGRAVFTVRPAAEGGGFTGREPERLALMEALAEMGPAYFDVELRALEANPRLKAPGRGGSLIVSWHDPVGTPARARLRSVIDRAASFGGLTKLVTTANFAADNLEILSLYRGPGPSPIAFCMGAGGILSRVMAIELGTPVAYASLQGERTAPGQLPLRQMLAIRRRLGAD